MPKLPQPLLSPQELTRLNNENEAVYRAFPQWLGRLWKRIKAEREARPIRAVGFFLPR